LPEFTARGTRIVAISVDPYEESRNLARKRGYTFTILSDPRAEAIRAYGVLHAHAGEDGHDLARPAEFLVNETGTIRWVNLAENLLARLRPETVLHVLDASPKTR
jgi:peroxiredoxin